MSTKRRVRLSCNDLESRFAPATLVNPTTLTYVDIDGDKVTVTASTGTFSLSNPNGGFGDTFALSNPNAIGGQQLLLVDLASPSFQGADFTVSVVKSGNGDGLAAVGLIEGLDLGTVRIQGDLSEIDCGDSDTSTAALKVLSVRSIGRYNVITQGNLSDLHSTINGAIGSLTVAADIKDAQIIVVAVNDADAKIGSIRIGGSLIGGPTPNSGSIFAEGSIGSVKIGGDVVGGFGHDSGQILSKLGANIGGITIGGSIIGGSGKTSGQIGSGASLGPVRISGSLIGGAGFSSGTVGGNKLVSLSLDGSLFGSSGDNSGSIFADDIGSARIAHDVKGGDGTDSGKIDAGGEIKSLTIGGSLIGGRGDYIGSGHVGQIVGVLGVGAVRIGHDVKGGAGTGSGSIFSLTSTMLSAKIGGSVVGGTGTSSGTISADAGIGPIRIGHDLFGGEGYNAGSIEANAGPIGSVGIGGSLMGGSGNLTGRIYADGDMGTLTIAHDLLGGIGERSGYIECDFNLAGVAIGGSLIGGSGENSGSIFDFLGSLGKVKIGHDFVGGSTTGMTPTLDGSGTIESFTGHIKSVFIGGSIIAGTDSSSAGDSTRNATIRAGDDIGSITVKGSLIGNVGPDGNSLVIISARGQANPSTTSDVAIGEISIGGRVEFVRVFAGYDTDLVARNADAQIGAVTVGSDWTASSMIAGGINLGDDDLPGVSGSATADNVNFGDRHDFKIDEQAATGHPDSSSITSRIASITIAGQVFGLPRSAVNDIKNFGFVAEQIGALTVGNRLFSLVSAPLSDAAQIGPTRNIALHEIGAAFVAAPPPIRSAKFVNASTVSYDDVDGDHVTVTLSKPLLTVANVNDIFKFDTGIVGDGIPAHQQLQLINITPIATPGLSLSVTVLPDGGDGFANIGAITSLVDLGTVSVAGDLGRIDAGDANAQTTGLGALAVRSLGRLGVDAQPPASASFTPGLKSEITGALGTLTVQQDIVNADIEVAGAIGVVTIGGSLIGGAPPNSGVIFASTDIGSVTIGRDAQGGIGNASGRIGTDVGDIVAVTVGGSVIGGVGTGSGFIAADGTVGTVKIGHNLIGGTGLDSGTVAGNTLGGISIAGSLLGGLGNFSGSIRSSSGDMGAVTIGHDFVGGPGDQSGRLYSFGRIKSISIGGSLVGGAGNYGDPTNPGQIFSVADMGAINVGHDVHGGAGEFSGNVFSQGKIAGATITGSLIGGSKLSAGAIFSNGQMGPVKIGHDVIGGTDIDTGRILTFDALGPVSVRGSLIGGAGFDSGAIINDKSGGNVTIGHDLIGGAAIESGLVSGSDISRVSVGGSVVGGAATYAGMISGGEFGAIKIGRDLIGGNISGTQPTLDSTGYIQGARIASVSIGGSIIAGSDSSSGGALTRNASIRSLNDIGTITVNGSLIGNLGDGTAGNLSRVIISAQGQPGGGNDAPEMAIKSVSIGGRVEWAQILAGYDVTLTNKDGDASIGPVTVGRDWIASDLVAGARSDGNSPSTPTNFGNADDEPMFGITGGFGQLQSVAMKGVVVGATYGPIAHFGFVAPEIVSFKSLGFTALLPPGRTFDVVELSPITGDITVREVS